MTVRGAIGCGLACVLFACSGSRRGPPEVGADAAVEVGVDASPWDMRLADSRADVFVPFSLTITINRIPATMNGSQPFTDIGGKLRSFRLTVPVSGFTVDVSWRGSMARPESLQVLADVPLGSGAIPAGRDLSQRFKRDGDAAHLRVDRWTAAAEGPLTLTARLKDGATVREASISVDVKKQTFLTNPFRLEDTWLLVYSQDLYAITSALDAKGNWTVQVTKGANQLADFEEDLRAVGLGSAKMSAAAQATTRDGLRGTNAIMLAWIKGEILANLRRAYGLAADGSRSADSVGIHFVAQGAAGAPKLADYRYQKLSGVETQKAFSAIGIGGGDPTQPFLGRSKTVDPNNLQSEDNLGPGFGVFTSSALAKMATIGAQDPRARQGLDLLLGGFLPMLGRGGVPVGEHAVDPQILAQGFDVKQASGKAVGRYRKLVLLVDVLGRLVGALTAHEIGHALGLVASGPPPFGLFGGARKAPFAGPRTAAGHLDTPGFNIMEAGPASAPNAPIDISQYFTAPHFNALNLAYLRGRIVLLP